MNGQMSIFDYDNSESIVFRIDKPIRLIELFSGLGAQAKALERLGANFEHYKTSDWEVHSCASYHKIHLPEDTFDYSKPYSDDEVRDMLYALNISLDGKKPMTKKEITRKNNKWCREVFNDFMATNNLGSIMKTSGQELEIVDKDKYTYILTWSFPCFTKDTLVLTKNGYKEIKDVVVGDLVLSHDNTYKKVIASSKTGEHKIIEINGMGIDKICCTPNHPFYVRTKHRVNTHLHGKPIFYRYFDEPIWKEAKYFTKNDYLGIAINQNSIIPSWNGYSQIYSDGRVYERNLLSQYMNNPDFWWLIGAYVGDGWIRNQGGIIICGNEKKKNDIVKKAEKLKLNYNIVQERTCIKIHFPIKELSIFVEDFGHGAANKKIPGYVFDMPTNLLKSFLEGYFNADGSISKNGYKRITSTSKTLIYGTAQLITKVFKCPYRIYKIKRKPTCIIEGRNCNQLNSYEVVWKTERRKQDKAFYEDGFVWFPINKISITNNIEEVYDIEVEQNHSFVANGVIVHNCTDLSIAGRQAGMTKDSGTASSLCWEVIRLLKETEQLPDILLMENVPQVHGKKYYDSFLTLQKELEDLGYTNFWQDMNAKDYGIPQSRNRCFMISILQKNVKFNFPESIELDKVMADCLESKVEEKYYIHNEKSQKLINELMANGFDSDKATIDLSINSPRQIEIANCIKARVDAGISNFKSDGSGIIEKSGE